MKPPTLPPPPPDSPSPSPSPSPLPSPESLFRSHPIPHIRSLESSTRRDISQKHLQLRHLIAQSYRSLLLSADSILLLKSSCHSISSNLSLILSSLPSLSSIPSPIPSCPSPLHIFPTASRLKYLVDTPDHIWASLHQSLLLPSSSRYLRAKLVHSLLLLSTPDESLLSRFPLLPHQWAIVQTFKSQISLRCRDRLMEPGLPVESYADALAAAAVIDDLEPRQVLGLFLESRRGRMMSGELWETARMVRASLGQVGMLFKHALNEMPLFYKLVLGSPPGSQLFGGVADPEEEVRAWRVHREKLESVMVLLDPEFVGRECYLWLERCCEEIFGVVRGFSSGEEIVAAEKMVRGALDGREGLEESLEEWLRGVFGSDVVKSPWKQICGLVLKDGRDLFGERMEQAFVMRMKEIVRFGFEELRKEVSIKGSVEAIVSGGDGAADFYGYLEKSSKGGGVWFSELNQKRTGVALYLKTSNDENDFRGCLNAYFGPEVSRIRDVIDKRLGGILDDLLCFIESHNGAIRLKELAPHIQDECYKAMVALLGEIEEEMTCLSVSLVKDGTDNESLPSSVIVERSLFLGRLMYALRNHSSHIPLILGSPRQWVKETSGSSHASALSPLSKQYKESVNSPISFSSRRHAFDSPPSPGMHSLETHRRQAFAAAAALFTVDNSTNLKLEELSGKLQDLCIRAHSLWITWVSNELSIILSSNLNHDDALSVTNPLRGWEVTVIKQDEPTDDHLEMQITLPSMASQYIISFLFQACQEIHKVGGHVLDKVILQNFASELLKKVIEVYENFLAKEEASKSHISEKGILQIMLDLRFSADVLSGGKDANSMSDELLSGRRKVMLPSDSSLMEIVLRLINRFSQRLDPIDWATYEPYLWENEKQSYKRCSVLFGFFTQLNRLYIDTVQKSPIKSNSEFNILRCSTVPRFKYLPITAPALSSRGAHKSVLHTSIDDASPSSPWSTYSNGERSPKPDFDDSLSLGAATPLLKSFMTQVGSKFGESTSRWGSMLSDGQVGKLKDRSAAAMSTFGDMLPGPAAGLLSSFTSNASRYDSL